MFEVAGGAGGPLASTILLKSDAGGGGTRDMGVTLAEGAVGGAGAGGVAPEAAGFL